MNKIKEWGLNNMKSIKLFVFFAFLFVAQMTYGQMYVTAFKVFDEYLENGKIRIKNTTSTTTIKIQIQFGTHRTNGSPNPGSVKTRLSTPGLNGQPNYLSEQELSSSSEFESNLILTKEYTIAIEKSKLANGNIYLFVEPNGFGEGTYSSKSYQYILEMPNSSIIMAPFYLSSVDYLFKLNGSIPPSGAQNHGVNFKAYLNPNSMAELGTVQFGEYRFKVIKENGALGYPNATYFYSASPNFTPPAAPPGHTFVLEYSTAAKIYAFNRQVTGTVPILQCRHKILPIVFYLPASANISNMYDTSIAFYAYVDSPILNPTLSPVEDNDLTKIQSMGFSTIGITNFSSTHYLVEGDVLIKKSSLSVNNPLYSVNNDKEHNINVWVKPAINPANSDWNNAVSQAVAMWNANPSCDIKLHIVYQYGTSDVPPPYDIIVDTDLGNLPSNRPTAAEYPSGDGKSGGLILVNLDYAFSSTNQLVNNMIHALGHTLGFKHNSAANSIMVNNNLAGYTNAFPGTVDEPVISTLYPLNVNSTVTPYISGMANIPYSSWTQDFNMSYLVFGNTYTWTSNTPHWLLPYERTSQTKLPEMEFATGSHQLQCTTSHSKYTTPIIAIKNIVVQ